MIPSLLGAWIKPYTAALGEETLLYLPLDSDINDHSIYGHTFVAQSDAALHGAVSKFGTNSLALPSSTAYLLGAGGGDTSRFALTGDFTFEHWQYVSGSWGTYPGVRYFSTGANNYNFGGRDSGGATIGYVLEGTAWYDTAWTPPSTAWVHICYQRKNGELAVFKDGVLVSVSTLSGTNIRPNANANELKLFTTLGNNSIPRTVYVCEVIFRNYAVYNQPASMTPGNTYFTPPSAALI